MAITATPASPTAAVDAVAIAITGLSTNDAGTYDAANYPTEDALVYKTKAVAPAGSTPALDLTSEAWTCDEDGNKTMLPWVFPVAGTWTIEVIDQADQGVTASQALVVA